MRNLIEFAADFVEGQTANDIPVMTRDADGRGWHQAARAVSFYGLENMTAIEVGDQQDGDQERGAYAWWPLDHDGVAIGELRETGAGLVIYAMDL